MRTFHNEKYESESDYQKAVSKCLLSMMDTISKNTDTDNPTIKMLLPMLMTVEFAQLGAILFDEEEK